MAYVVGATITDLIEPADAGGSLVSGIASTLTANLYTRKPNGSSFSPTIAEIGSTGRYTIAFTPNAAGDWYWSTSYTTPLQRFYETYDVLPAAADPAAIATAVAAVQTTLLGSEVTVTSPLATDGTIMLCQGDTYDSDETRAIVFSLTGQPNLTSATATLLLSWGVDSLALTGVITNAGQTTQTITVELTAAQTATLPVTGITYALKATLANAHVVTMQTGRVIVSAALPAN